MKILDAYIRRTVWQSSFNVMAVLVSVFTFFRFIEELNQLGKGSYGVMQALQFVLLSMPELAYELCPVGALLGSLLGLGTMLTNSELTIIRASGIPIWRIIYAVVKAGLVIALIAVLVGEFIVPPCEQYAHMQRSIAINEQLALKSRNGLWVRDGTSFVNIRKLLPNNQVEEVYIYEFGNDRRLRASTHAKRAHYAGGAWELEDVEQTILRPQRTVQRKVPRAKWESKLDGALVNDVVIKPYSLSVRDLARFSDFLEQNGQSSLQYRQALWYKLFYPLAAGAMVFLAVPVILTTSSRSTALGQRIIVGASIGLVFHLINKTTGYVGYIFDLAPITSVTLPTLVTLSVGMLLMQRVR